MEFNIWLDACGKIETNHVYWLATRTDVKIENFNSLGMIIIWPYSKFYIDHDFSLKVAEYRILLSYNVFFVLRISITIHFLEDLLMLKSLYWC